MSNNGMYMGTIFLAAGALTLTAIAAAIIYGLLRGETRGQIASFLLEASAKDGEPGKPSISRLQMLIWNFVIAFAFLYVLGNLGLQEGLMPVPLHPEDGAETTTTKLAAALQALFSPEILILLGISNLTYLFGKITPQASAQPASAEGAGAGASATGATASNAAGHQAVEAVQLVPTHSGVGAAGPVG